MTDHAKPTKEEVVALETAYWDAMKAKDGDRAAKLSGETSLVTGAQGAMSIPRSKMGKMTEEGDWTLESYAFDDVEVVGDVHGSGTYRRRAGTRLVAAALHEARTRCAATHQEAARA